MKVYVDSNVVSLKPKGELSKESDAFDQLLLISYEGDQLELVTSVLTAKEIEAYKGEPKDEIKRMSNRLKRISFIEDHRVLGFHSQWENLGGVSYPLVEDDSIASILRKILPRKRKNRVDAHHVMLAIRAECDVFLTCDKKTILVKRSEIEKRFPIKLMTPSALLQELTETSDLIGG